MGRSDVDLRDDENRDDERRDDARRRPYRDNDYRDDDYRDGEYRNAPTRRGVARQSHRSPETKTFLASSEFWVTVGAVVALFIGGYMLNDITNSDAWKWATWIAIAYIVSRGIAKAGSQRMSETVSQTAPMRDPAPPRV